MVTYGFVWYGFDLFGMIWFGLIWFDLVWFGLVLLWYDLVRGGGMFENVLECSGGFQKVLWVVVVVVGGWWVHCDFNVSSGP